MYDCMLVMSMLQGVIFWFNDTTLGAAYILMKHFPFLPTQSNYLQLPVKCQDGAVSTQSMDLKSCKLRA